MPKPAPFFALSLLGRLPILAALAWAGEAGAQQTITKTISTSPDLIAAFAVADQNPANTYVLNLTWRRDASGATVLWKPQSPVTLTKGKVQVVGSTSHLNPDRYVFDGEGKRQLFVVQAASGFKPTLTLSGLTVQHGKSTSSGGGLQAFDAWDIQIYWCIFANNASNTLGGGIFMQNVHNFYMVHSEVDFNLNGQYPDFCGNGQMGGGGGIFMGSGANTDLHYAAIHWSTVFQNTACRGGGIMANGPIQLTMTNNSIIENKAAQFGGGMYLNFSTAFTQLYFNTIAGNHAGVLNQTVSGYPRTAGGVAFSDYTGDNLWTGNVIASNFVDFPQTDNGAPAYRTDDCYTLSGARNGRPYNNFLGLLSNCTQLGSFGAWGIGSAMNPANPKLTGPNLPVNANGFSMYVYSPASDSPLRGNYHSSGSGYVCPADDEMGTRRPVTGSCDIGAIEYKP